MFKTAPAEGLWQFEYVHNQIIEMYRCVLSENVQVQNRATTILWEFEYVHNQTAGVSGA